MKDIFTIKKEYIINFFENYIINIYMICIYYITFRLLFYIYISNIFMILFIVLILGLFIIFNIDLFILNNTICTLSPRLLNPIIQNPNSENIQENLEYLQEKLVAERKDYNIQKNSFDANVNRLFDYFNNNILHIEFSRTNVIVQFKSSDNSPSINT